MKIKEMEGQLSLWEIATADAPDEIVPIHHALNMKERPIKEYDVSLATGDLELIVCMIEDYIKGLDVAMAGNVNWECFYRKKYQKISAEIQSKINYDYAAKVEKCRKKQEKEEDDDVGGEALSLAMKKAVETAKREHPEDYAVEKITDKMGEVNKGLRGLVKSMGLKFNPRADLSKESDKLIFDNRLMEDARETSSFLSYALNVLNAGVEKVSKVSGAPKEENLVAE